MSLPINVVPWIPDSISLVDTAHFGRAKEEFYFVDFVYRTKTTGLIGYKITNILIKLTHHPKNL